MRIGHISRNSRYAWTYPECVSGADRAMVQVGADLRYDKKKALIDDQREHQ